MNSVRLKAETERKIKKKNLRKKLATRQKASSILAEAGSLLEGSAGDQGVQPADDQGGKGV